MFNPTIHNNLIRSNLNYLFFFLFLIISEFPNSVFSFHPVNFRKYPNTIVNLHKSFSILIDGGLRFSCLCLPRFEIKPWEKEDDRNRKTWQELSKRNIVNIELLWTKYFYRQQMTKIINAPTPTKSFHNINLVVRFTGDLFFPALKITNCVKFLIPGH